MLLRPKSFGTVPAGLPKYHTDFLQWLKESVEILSGSRKSQLDTAVPPRSQAVVFGDTQYHIGYFTRDVSAPSGNVNITGIPFQPSLVEFSVAGIVMCGNYVSSVGFDDGANHYCVDALGGNAARSISIIETFLSDGADAYVSGWLPNGFTLTWTKYGTPAANTHTIIYKARR